MFFYSLPNGKPSIFFQSLKKKLLGLFSFNFQFKESDDNKLQGGTKVQELTLMNYYYSHASSRVSTQQEDENKLGYYSISHQTTDKSNGMFSEISINEVYYSHNHGHGHVRVRREVNSKVEKKKCPRCSRWCKYYSTKTKSTAAGSVSTIITCPSCGKKFDPKATLSAANKLATKSSLHWQKQDQRRLSLQVR